MRTHVWATALVLVGTSASAAEPPSTEGRIPELRLHVPEWHPMRGEQLKAMFSGSDLTLDEGYEPLPGVRIKVAIMGGCPPSEKFFADGRWALGECGVQYRVYDGHWTIEPKNGGEWLCVEAADFPKACRFVWRGRGKDQVFMPVFGEADWRKFWINPYKLTPSAVPRPAS